MNIGLFTSVFYNNIGNAFIDYGADITIKAAMPEGAKIVKLSQCANFAASLGTAFMLKEMLGVRWLWEHFVQHFEKYIHDRAYNTISTLDVFSPVKIAKLDYLVIPGCVLTDSFFTIYGNLLEEKTSQNCKLIFLGASGNYYTEKEVKCVKTWLKRLHPYAIMFRDTIAYNYYSECSKNTYNGIDNVFFVNRLDLQNVETMLDPYIVLNFDIPKHKKIENELKRKYGNKIVYTDHKPYPYSKISKLAKQNIMCSDYPLDYLFIYKNVAETHSDRVHACIPTLSFGHKAQLYSDSPRISLFENVGIDIEEMKMKPISLDQSRLKDLQDKQIEFLKGLF